ncbi:MAG: serine/threonine protein kinase, partial [Gemmatimonadetes bacterium]|nr:serine/threonine protein kinase [Gemmatimonadota bacterium]
AGDPELERRVRALLRAEDAADGFLETPVARVQDAARSLPDDAHIGPYRLVRPLGGGGMGDVFLGVQEEADFRRYAAIKVMRQGAPAGFAERFARERAILAGLGHPGIARFLGGGTTDDGRAFFVMEHIEGERLDRYCDRRVLSIRERVELMRQVCLAVQHAHGNLVVHRDLKPSNILVTAEGAPKLLDFGIAKLLSSDAPEETRTGFRLATPEYAAPEQIRGDPISTATDVYALGVLLYESLCGHRPFSAAEASGRALASDPAPAPPPSLAAGRFATRQLPDGDQETVTPEDVSAKRRTEPTALRRRLQGDLDNIVARALRFAPEERYVSAAALADDLERWLTGRPVRARPDSLLYRTSKFVRRNRAATLVGVALALTLVIAALVTLLQNQRIRTESARVAAERDRALAVQGFLLESFGASGGDALAGDSVTVRQVLDGQAAQVEDAYAGQPATRAEMLHVLADGYERLGAWEPAERWARRAVEERRSLAGGAADADLARSLTLLGWILRERNALDEAEASMAEALSVWRTLEADSAGLSRTLNDLSGVLMSQGRLDEAEPMAREALEIRRATLPANDRGIAITANNLANVLGLQGRHEESAELLREAVAILEETLGPYHRRTLTARRNLAVRYGWLGDWERSAEIGKQLVDGFERLGSDDLGLAFAMEAYGGALWRTGALPQADSVLDRGLAIASARSDGAHEVSAWLHLQKAALRQSADRREEALEQVRAAVDVYDRMYDDHPMLATTLGRLGAMATDPSERVRAHRAAAEMWTRLEGDADARTLRASAAWGQALVADGRPRDALPLFEALAHTLAATPDADPLSAPAPHLGRAEALAALGDTAAARTALEEATPLLTGEADVTANREWKARVEALLRGTGGP